MSPLNIRPARPDDIGGLSSLFVELDEHHFSRAAPGEFLTFEGPVRSPEHIAQLITAPDSAVLVAEVDGVIAGFTHVFVRQIAANIVAPERKVAEMDTLVVAQEHRRQGIARRLVEAAVTWARAQGLGALELNVRGFNREAGAFYESLGFESISRRMRRRLD
jgi:diamine N-acetyltransferase